MSELDERPKAALSVRQTQVALLLGRGLLVGEIAAKLGIAKFTVTSHLKFAREATGVHNSTHLAVLVALAHERQRLAKEMKS